MGLMNKLKNILFEEEEVEIPILEKKEKKEGSVPKELPKKEDRIPVFGHDSYSEELEPTISLEKSLEQHEEIRRVEELPKKEEIKPEKTFNFPSFDEEEFESFNPKPKENNILEREREKKNRAYVAPEKRNEDTEKKFRPSPIISPVYGILDKNYTPDEITSRETKEFSRKLDVDDVRKKAFGNLEPKEEITYTKTEDDKIFEEKLEKARTIDELLKESSDEVITIKDEIPSTDTLELTQEINDLNVNEPDLTLEDLDKKEESNVDDTLESDLFDLIDSMYENREDGE